MKENTKTYLKRMGIAYLLAITAFLFKVCRNNRINNFYTMTSNTLLSGSYIIYDDNINKVGTIEYKNNNGQLEVSIKGQEINGVIPYLEESYNYAPMEYNNICMTLQKYEDEFYYYYDTGESVLIICLLRSWFTNYSPLEKLAKKMNKYGMMKDRQTFMFLNVDYKSYQFAFDYPNPTIQNHFTSEGGVGQLYRCFFIQDNEL